MYPAVVKVDGVRTAGVNKLPDIQLKGNWYFAR